MNRSQKMMSILALMLGWTVAFSASASAATILGSIKVNHNTYYSDGLITVWGGGYSGVTGNGGIYGLQIVTPPAPTGDGLYITNDTVKNYVVAFCTELPQGSHINVGELYNVIMPAEGPGVGTGILPSGGPMGVAKQNALRELWGRYITEALTSGTKAEAFSAAIWEIVYEAFPANPADWNVTSGTGFKASAVDTALANTWLHSLDGTGPLANLRLLTNPTYQDFLVEVPEPASLALIALGGLALLRRHRK